MPPAIASKYQTLPLDFCPGAAL